MLRVGSSSAMKFEIVARAEIILSLAALVLISLTCSASAGNPKPAANTIPRHTAAKTEECSPPSTASRNAPPAASASSQTQSNSAANYDETEIQSPSAGAAMKLKLQDQGIEVASPDCSKDSAQSGTEKCRERAKPTAPQCEHNSSPERDLVVPSSNPGAQQE